MNNLILWDDLSAIGKISIQSDDGVVLGDFDKFLAYAKYAELFERYEEAAGNQELVEIDRLDKIIESYKFRVADVDGVRLRFVRDLQRTSSGISFRW